MRKDYRMIAVDAKLHTDLKVFCVMHGVTMTGLVTELIKNYMTTHAEKETINGK